MLVPCLLRMDLAYAKRLGKSKLIPVRRETIGPGLPRETATEDRAHANACPASISRNQPIALTALTSSLAPETRF